MHACARAYFFDVMVLFNWITMAEEVELERSGFLWREAVIDKLIKLFRESPCLYDTSDDQYHNKDQKRVVFDRIAEELGTDCK